VPSASERRDQPHHLFDALSLGEAASAGWYARVVGETCAAIHDRGRVPVLVGGSGLYLRAARTGLAPTPPRSAKVRAELEGWLAEQGPEVLHRELAISDPETAARLGVRDAQRIVRALEVFQASGRPLSWWHAQAHAGTAPGRWCVIELVLDARSAGERIAARPHAMFEAGLLDEARTLLDRGLEQEVAELQAIGYDEAVACLAGRLSRSDAEARTTLRTRQLGKRQRTWFRREAGAVRLDAALGVGPNAGQRWAAAACGRLTPPPERAD
jgi:tRNA dimethylallyltransferase